MDSYLASREKLHTANPYLFIKANGHRPTRQWFLQLARRSGSKFLRRGGVTYYASHGFPVSFLQLQGRWSSRAWKLYLDDHVDLHSLLTVKPLPIASASYSTGRHILSTTGFAAGMAQKPDREVQATSTAPTHLSVERSVPFHLGGGLWTTRNDADRIPRTRDIGSSGTTIPRRGTRFAPC